MFHSFGDYSRCHPPPWSVFGPQPRATNKASCLSLLSNAELVWNTVQMGAIVARLRASGEKVADEDLARISPLAEPKGNAAHYQALAGARMVQTNLN